MGVGVGVGVAAGVGVGVGVATGVGVGVGVGVAAGPRRSEHWANSEVLPFGSVAAAVMKLPEGIAIGKVTAKLARQLPSVVTVAEPMNVSPSPKPEGSQAPFEKNSILNVDIGRAIQRSLDGRAAARAAGGRDDRKVLTVVGARVAIARIVRRHPIAVEIDAEARVREHGIRRDGT